MESPITIDPEIQFGTPVFTGTRVPVKSLFWHLESGISLDAFLDDFPSVSRAQAIAVLDLAGKALSSDKLSSSIRIYGISKTSPNTQLP